MSNETEQRLEETLLDILEIGSLEMQHTRGYLDTDGQERLNTLKTNFDKVIKEGVL